MKKQQELVLAETINDYEVNASLLIIDYLLVFNIKRLLFSFCCTLSLYQP